MSVIRQGAGCCKWAWPLSPKAIAPDRRKGQSGAMARRSSDGIPNGATWKRNALKGVGLRAVFREYDAFTGFDLCFEQACHDPHGIILTRSRKFMR